MSKLSESDQQSNPSIGTHATEPEFSISPLQLEILRQFRPSYHPDHHWDFRINALPGLLDPRFNEHDKGALWLHWADLYSPVYLGQRGVGSAVKDVLKMVEKDELHFENPADGLTPELADLLTTLLGITNSARDKTLLVLGIRILHGLPIPLPPSDKP